MAARRRRRQGAARARIDLHVHTGRDSQCAETVDPYVLRERVLAARVAGSRPRAMDSRGEITVSFSDQGRNVSFFVPIRRPSKER